MIDTAAGPLTMGLPETATSVTFISDVRIGGVAAGGGNLTGPRPHAPREDARGGTTCRMSADRTGQSTAPGSHR